MISIIHSMTLLQMHKSDNKSPAKVEIRIRPVEDADTQQVRELLWRGMCVDGKEEKQIHSGLPSFNLN